MSLLSKSIDIYYHVVFAYFWITILILESTRINIIFHRYMRSPFCDQNKVSEAVYDDRPLILLDDVRQDRKRRRQTSVSVREDVYIRAFGPRRVERCVDGLLDLRTIEVDQQLLLWERPTCDATHEMK